MKDGIIKVASCTPQIKVADTDYNADRIIEQMNIAYEEGASIIAFPELCVTGATCRDLFCQAVLLSGAKAALAKIMKATEKINALVFVGLPMEIEGALYDVAAALYLGQIVGMTPRHSFDKRDSLGNARYFAGSYGAITDVIPTYKIEGIPGLNVGVCVGGDFYKSAYDFARTAKRGASLIVCMDATPELVTAENDRINRLTALSSQFDCDIIYASAGEGESTTDNVFAGQKLIIECGQIIAKSKCFDLSKDRHVCKKCGAVRRDGILIQDLDTAKSIYERMVNGPIAKMGCNGHCGKGKNADNMGTSVLIPITEPREVQLTRVFPKNPFVPASEDELKARCEKILTMQAMGLKKRLDHTGVKSVVLGISGGLDSTLALLVCAKAFDMAGRDRKGIISITMPCFGTTARTKGNASVLTELLGATLREINIEKAVNQHFEDIGHNPSDTNVTYENSQARERTQVLMDVANDTAGLVVGTGDMSELALGWATYNGDHMSMYDVNAGVPKTMLRHLVRYYADTCGDEKVAGILMDILDTPVSPELLPPKDGEISQCTENLVGPYELHDFFLYYCLRWGYGPQKIYRLAVAALDGQYEADVILSWEKKFFSRFIGQQFKRSCLADGPKIGSVGVGPRGDLCMPSDAVSRLWQAELEEM